MNASVLNAGRNIIMPVWKYANDKEITLEELERVLTNLICFKCGKELHSDNCPFAKLRVELNALKRSENQKKEV